MALTMCRASVHMTFNSRSRRKHSIAMPMLFLWVFVLISGVANACLTEPRTGLTHAASLVLTAGDAAHASRHAAVTAASDDADNTAAHSRYDDSADKAPCQKPCEESAKTLPKQASKLDTPDLQPLALLSRAWLAGLLHPSQESGAILRAAIPTVTLPLRVSLSRLAL